MTLIDLLIFVLIRHVNWSRLAFIHGRGWLVIFVKFPKFDLTVVTFVLEVPKMSLFPSVPPRGKNQENLFFFVIRISPLFVTQPKKKTVAKAQRKRKNGAKIQTQVLSQGLSRLTGEKCLRAAANANSWCCSVLRHTNAGFETRTPFQQKYFTKLRF